MATTSLPTLPHPTLTKITGKPKPKDIVKLKEEVYANAGAVPSRSGGGAHGHLGAVVDAATYTILSGQNTAFTAPAAPVEPTNATSSTAAMNASRAYVDQARIYDTYVALMNVLQQQILAAVEPLYLSPLRQAYTGFSNVQPIDMIDHLDDKYGEPSADDLIENRDSIAEPWNPDVPLEQLFSKIEDCLSLAQEAGAPITDNETMALALRALHGAGVYGSAIEQWETRASHTKTWANFQEHFLQHDKYRLKKQGTARQAGYHRANMVTTASGDHINLQDLLNAAANQALEHLKQAQQENPPPTQPICQTCNKAAETPKEDPKPKGTMVQYCWTHGLTRAGANHNSKTCRTRAPGHDITATLNNQKGGSVSIHMLTPLQQRRSNQSN